MMTSRAQITSMNGNEDFGPEPEPLRQERGQIVWKHRHLEPMPAEDQLMPAIFQPDLCIWVRTRCPATDTPREQTEDGADRRFDERFRTVVQEEIGETRQDAPWRLAAPCEPGRRPFRPRRWFPRAAGGRGPDARGGSRAGGMDQPPSRVQGSGLRPRCRGGRAGRARHRRGPQQQHPNRASCPDRVDGPGNSRRRTRHNRR